MKTRRTDPRILLPFAILMSSCTAMELEVSGPDGITPDLSRADTFEDNQDVPGGGTDESDPDSAVDAAGSPDVLSSAPSQPTVSGVGRVYAGAYSMHVGRYTEDLVALGDASGTPMTFSGTFVTASVHDGTQTRPWLDAMWAAGTTPVVNVGLGPSSTPVTAAAIAAGRFDADIAAWGDEVLGWLSQGGDRSLIVLPLQEMNGSWVSYGQDPENYRFAYQRFVTILRHDKGIDETLLRFGWAPNEPFGGSIGQMSPYFPGAGVDLVGYSTFSRAADSSDARQVIAAGLAELKSIVPRLPIFLFQVGRATTDFEVPRSLLLPSKTEWVQTMFDACRDDPNLIGFVYFNWDRPGPEVWDYRIFEHPTINPTWVTKMAEPSTLSQFPLDDWFLPGAIGFNAHPRPLCAPGQTCDAIALVAEEGRWMAMDDASHASAAKTFWFGGSADLPLMGDWDCDGVTTPGVFSPTTATWSLRNANSDGQVDHTFAFGDTGDVPLVGDWNNDGCDTVALHRPSTGQFFYRNTLTFGAASSHYFGDPGDRAIAGDFDGDGFDTFGLYRPSTSRIYYRNDLRSGPAEKEFGFGNPSDVIFVGDWDGDGSQTPGLYRPSNGTVYLRNSNSSGVADYDFYVGSFAAVLAR